MNKIIDTFNKTLKVLIKDLYNNYPSDALIYRAYKRVCLVIDYEPLIAIKNVGYYLIRYKDLIYSVDENDMATITKFFIENTYDSELKESVNKEKADLVQYIIPKAKECALKFNDERKKEYFNIIRDLLDGYIDYLSLTV